MTALVLLAAALAGSPDSTPGAAPVAPDGNSPPVEITVEEQETRRDEAALEEDPEARRRRAADAGIEVKPVADKGRFSLDLYSSVRVHLINTFNLENGSREFRVSDGNSRAGGRINWDITSNWSAIARAEVGFDVIEQFSTRGPDDGDGGLTQRLLFAGVDSRTLTLTYGKDWSTYYSIAGMTDRFAIFGGSAAGVYNAGTDGGATGTGRADDILKARIYLDSDWGVFGKFKPGNLNLQLQRPQPIPQVPGVSYDYGWGASGWLETKTEYGLGLAINVSAVPDVSAVREAGIDGDALAAAISARTFGERWYVSFLYSRLENIETTDQNKYINTRGVEIYAQWEPVPKWWLIGGLNALEPDDDDPDAGEYRVRYGIVGARYSFRSFERMLYVEYRIDDSRAVDGTRLENEITFGVRWDFE